MARMALPLPEPAPDGGTADRPVRADRTAAPRPAAAPRPDPDGAPAESAQQPAARQAGGDELTDLEREVLDLESGTWRHSGAKDHAIRRRLGLSPTAYYQVLNALLEREAALAYRPLLVARLRSSRGTRRRVDRGAVLRRSPDTASPRQEI